MNGSQRQVCVAAIAFIVAAFPVHGGELSDNGQVEVLPWSGFWWPHLQGGLRGPLTKYDRIEKKHSVDWELSNHPSDSAKKWHGFCHAWASSSVLETEPKAVCKLNSDGAIVCLSIGDQKGLLAACHTNDIANIHGDRYGDNLGSEDRSDIAPDRLWELLRFYIRQQQLPLLLDIEAGEQVWNYPVYSYDVKCESTSNGNYNAVMTLLMADNGVRPDFVGLKPRKATYTFSFRMTDGSVVPGTAKWTGLSEKNHPDFAWYPYIARAENPEIDYGAVETLLKLVSDPEAEAVSEGTSTAVEPEGGPNEATNSPIIDNNPIDAPATVESPNVADEDTERPVREPASNSAIPSTNERIHVLSPNELLSLVLDKNSSFLVDAQFSAFDGAMVTPGSRVQVRVLTENTGYLYVFLVNPSGALSILMPRQVGEDNRVESTEAAAKLSLQVPTAVGEYTVKAIVSKAPLLLSAVQSGAQASQQQAIGSQQQSPATFRLNPTQEQQFQAALTGRPSGGVAAVHNITIGEFGQDRFKFRVRADSKQGRVP